MDHTRLDDSQVAERYVMGRLSEEERHGFEEHLIDCPRCLETIEAVEGLRDGLRESPTESTSAVSAPAVPFRPRPRKPWMARPLVTLLAAACVPFAVLSALFLSQAGSARRETEDAKQALSQAMRRQAELEWTLQRERAEQARGSEEAASRREALLAAPVFMLNLTRGEPGGEPENRVVLPDSPGWVTLVVDRPQTRKPQGFRVRLATADGQSVGGVSAAAAPSGDWLAVSLPTASLGAGDYVLVVEGSATGEPLATYRFRAVRKP